MGLGIMATNMNLQDNIRDTHFGFYLFFREIQFIANSDGPCNNRLCDGKLQLID